MKRMFVVLLFLTAVPVFAQKTYGHASEYRVAVLDENARYGNVFSTDQTLGKTQTDAKLDQGGQGFHFLHTEQGNYRVEAPVNKGATFLAAMAKSRYEPTVTYHNKWFLDKVAAGTNVLFAAHCNKPNKKHPNDTVHCEFWFPDPDSTEHEYRTLGDFTPYQEGSGSNVQKTANTLCGKGKLKPEVEAQVCPAPVSVRQEDQAAPLSVEQSEPVKQEGQSQGIAAVTVKSPVDTAAPKTKEDDCSRDDLDLWMKMQCQNAKK